MSKLLKDLAATVQWLKENNILYFLHTIMWLGIAIGGVILGYHSTQMTFFEHKETKEAPFKEEEWRNKWEDTVKTEKVIVDTIPRMLSYSEDITLSDGRIKTIIRVADRYDGVVQYFLINKY